MASGIRILGFFGLLCLAAQAQQHDHTPQPAKGTPWSTFGRDSPLQFFSLLSQLPVEEQRAYLMVAGASLQEQTHSVCNIFGGSSSCQALPAGSDFAQKCPNHDLKVDCAYYSEGLAEVQQDPAERLKTSLSAIGYGSLEAACPECFQNQLALWCAQTVPKCGSFSAAVEGSLLPAITTITQAQEAGRTPMEALSAAVPQLLAATDLSLPCSQMCEAVVSSCGCKTELRFGPLLDAYLATGTWAVPRGFAAQMFGSLYSSPICSLYGNTSAPGFAGHCDLLPQTCKDPQRWCDAQQVDSAGAEVQQLMAAQLAFALFGWLDAPAQSIFQDAATVVGNADQKDAKSLEDKYLVAGSSKTRSGSSTGAIVAHTLVAVALVALLAGAVFYVVRRRRQGNAWASGQGYLSMADDGAEQPGFLASEAPRI